MSDSFMTLWTVDHQPPLSCGILQARILEWVAISFSRGSSWPRDRTSISCLLYWQADSLPLVPPGKPLLKIRSGKTGLHYNITKNCWALAVALAALQLPTWLDDEIVWADLFLGIELLYNVVLVSALQQSESAVCMRVSYVHTYQSWSFLLNSFL